MPTNNNTLPDQQVNLDAALEYASRGWAVFPCRPAGKQPMTAHGLNDATTGENMIRRWWSAAPSCNVAVACGPGSIDVLDVDVHPGGSGWAALGKARRAGLTDGAQAFVRTPSGGAHLWFAGTDQRNGRLREYHLDFRSAGGYVLVPPSVVDGKAYEFLDRRDADGIRDWPAIRDLLHPARVAAVRPQDASADVSGLAAWVSRLPQGNRNDGCFWALCRAAESGADIQPLIDAAQAAGLSYRETASTAASAMRAAGRAA